MRYRVIVLLVIAAVATPASAVARGPSGSTEDTRGQVRCAKGTATPAAKVYAGANGAELCSGDNKRPDGRIIVTRTYVAADGDPSNGGSANGFIRVDSGGPSCGTAKKHDASAGRGGPCPSGGAPRLPVP